MMRPIYNSFPKNQNLSYESITPIRSLIYFFFGVLPALFWCFIILFFKPDILTLLAIIGTTSLILATFINPYSSNKYLKYIIYVGLFAGLYAMAPLTLAAIKKIISLRHQNSFLTLFSFIGPFFVAIHYILFSAIKTISKRVFIKLLIILLILLVAAYTTYYFILSPPRAVIYSKAKNINEFTLIIENSAEKINVYSPRSALQTGFNRVNFNNKTYQRLKHGAILVKPQEKISSSYTVTIKNDPNFFAPVAPNIEIQSIDNGVKSISAKRTWWQKENDRGYKYLSAFQNFKESKFIYPSGFVADILNPAKDASLVQEWQYPLAIFTTKNIPIKEYDSLNQTAFKCPTNISIKDNGDGMYKHVHTDDWDYHPRLIAEKLFCFDEKIAIISGYFSEGFSLDLIDHSGEIVNQYDVGYEKPYPTLLYMAGIENLKIDYQNNKLTFIQKRISNKTKALKLQLD